MISIAKRVMDRFRATGSGGGLGLASGKAVEGLPAVRGLETRRASAAAILIAVCLLAFLPGFAALPPVDRDESLFAQVTKQMLETGDYFDLRFQDEPFNRKPPGIYWLQSLSTALLGDPDAPRIWTYRVPSLLGAICAVLLTWRLGRQFFGRKAGFTAALILAGSLMLGFEARQAKTDAVLLAAIVGAQAALGYVYLRWRRGAPVSRLSAYLFWIATALGILVKMPVILLVSAGTILMLGIWDRAWGFLRCLRPASGACLALAISLPWFLATALSGDGEYFREAVGLDIIGKIFSGQESHGAPPGYYLLAFWFTFWPFAVLTGLSARWVWRNRAADPVRFCVSWILPMWLAFELFVTKLPHYVLPTFPALAILTAGALQDPSYWKGRTAGFLEWLLLGLWGLGTALLAAFVIALPLVVGGRFSLWFLLAVAGIAFAILHVVRLARDQSCAAGLVKPLLVASIAVFGAAYGGVLPGTEAYWLSSRVALVVEEHRQDCPRVPLVAVGYGEPSLVFLGGSNTKFSDPRNAALALAGDPGCGIAVISEEAEIDFQQAVQELGIRPRLIAEIPGINYTRTQETELKVYAGS